MNKPFLKFLHVRLVRAEDQLAELNAIADFRGDHYCSEQVHDAQVAAAKYLIKEYEELIELYLSTHVV